MYSGGVKLGRIVACPDNKTEQQKVELYYEDDPFCPSSYIIYPCSELSNSLSQIPPPAGIGSRQMAERITNFCTPLL